MKKVDLTGGSPTTITTAGNARGGSWAADGTIIFTPDFQSTIFRVRSDGKESAQPITQLDSTRHEGSHRWPFFLPDGKHFLYMARTASETGEAEGDGIFLGSVDGSTKTFLVQTSSNASYASGELFFIRGNALMAQRFDTDRLKLDGDPRKVLDGVVFDASYNLGAFGFSDNGLLVYKLGEAQNGAPNLILDRRGNVLLTIGDTSEQAQPRFSPDGQQLAVWLYDMRSRRSNIWIYDLRNEGRRRLTTTSGGDFFPVWSPDGSEIYFASRLNLNNAIFKQSTVQNSRETFLYSSPRSNIPLDRTPDGTTLILGTTSNTTSRDGDLWLLATTGKDPTPRPFQNTRFHEYGARISPDGKWVAFVSDETGEEEVYLKLLASPESQPWKLTTGGNQSPVWGGSANELIVTNKQHELVALGLQYLGNRPEVASVTKLFRLPRFTTGYDVSADGKRIVLSRQLEIRKMQPLTLVTNWPHLLEKNKEVP